MKYLAICCGWFAVLSAQPAHTCEPAVRTLNDARIPFEAQEVPLNAELRIPEAELSIASGTLLSLEAPDGSIVDVDVSTGRLGVLLSPIRPLVPGQQTLVFPDGERRVEFIVADELDEESPAPPIVSVRRDTTGNPLPFRSTCDHPWPVDVVSFEVEAESDAVMVSVTSEDAVRVGGLVAPDGPPSFIETRGGDVSYEVRVRDLAGNESDPTIVSAWSGCEGGCSSTSEAGMPLGLALFLISVSRRRRESH